MTVDNGVEVTLTANTFTRDGYTFKGWNDAKDGKGKSYADKAKVKPTANMTLFAQWEVKTVDITFDSNEGENSKTATQTVPVGQESVIEGPADWTLDGYPFLGWAKEKTAVAAEFTNGGKITVTEAVTLYAVWLKQEAGKVTIIFNGNGADEGSVMESQIVNENATVTLSKNTYTKNGYTFLGWSTDQAADTQEYADEAEITVNTEDVSLYAVWQENNGETPTDVTVTLSPSDKLISGETVTVALTGSDISGVSIENTVQVTGGVTERLSLSNSAFTVPRVENVTENVTLTFTLNKTGCADAERAVTATIYPATHVRYDGKIFSLAKEFDFTQTQVISGAQVATQTDYNQKNSVTGAEGGYAFNNTVDTRIHLELQNVTFDLMTVELKWNGGQPNFVFHGADAARYGYQFYKSNSGFRGWFLNGNWNPTDGDNTSIIYNNAPADNTFHTFRVYDKGNGLRSSQLDSEGIHTYSFSSDYTLSEYTATRNNGNGMFVQFGNDGNGGTDKRNFTVKAISFYSEVTE